MALKSIYSEQAIVIYCNYFATWLEMLTLKPNEIARECTLSSMSGETKNKTNYKRPVLMQVVHKYWIHTSREHSLSPLEWQVS